VNRTSMLLVPAAAVSASLVALASVGVSQVGVDAAFHAVANVMRPQVSAPTDAKAEGAISGVVKDAASGRPVPGALVQLAGGRNSAQRAGQITDGQGRFIFTDLSPARDYVLTATHATYLPGGFGAGSGG